MNAFQDPMFQHGMRLTLNSEVFPMRYINFEIYDEFVRETAIFQPNRGIQYCITKLCGEVGEFADKVAKAASRSHGFTDYFFFSALVEEERDGLILELGDIVWYITALSQQLGYSVAQVRGTAPRDPDEAQDAVNFLITALRMAGLAGSVAERAGKIIRDNGGDGTNASYTTGTVYFRKDTLQDLSTLLDRVDMIAGLMGSSLDEVLDRNVAKLRSRRARNVLSGSGDNR